MKELYLYNRPQGMGFTKKYSTPEEEKSAKAIQNRRRQLKCRYGITLEEYNNLLEKQNGKCAICLAEKAHRKRGLSLHVDHDHVTGRVRGLLCSRCNTSISEFENPEIRKRMMDYLGGKS